MSKRKRIHGPEALVAVLMGSKSDWGVMSRVARTLEECGVFYDKRVLSAHRTPEALAEYVREAEAAGVELFIAGAGGAAHLAGVIASQTLLPVLGVPLEGSTLKGLDALLATVQMPAGVPVGTLAIGEAGAVNAALLAVAVLAGQRPELKDRLRRYRAARAKQILREKL